MSAAPRRPSGFRAAAGPILPPSYYRRPTLRVARDLLGTYLVRRVGRALLAGRIVEVEAYLGRTDPASHAFRGRSPRNEAMFREGGCLYVYFTYGMHHCANVVTGRAGAGSAVLIRALEPVAGIRRMALNRGLPPGRVDGRTLTGGPARLCEAMGITKEVNGLLLRGPEIYITRGDAPSRSEIAASPRIGISAGADHPWRFFLRHNPCLSRP
jgi:DNA-3-methyladenine glycosylase